MDKRTHLKHSENITINTIKFLKSIKRQKIQINTGILKIKHKLASTKICYPPENKSSA